MCTSSWTHKRWWGRVFVYTGLLGWCVHHHGHTNVGGVECLCTQACWGDVYFIMDKETLVGAGCLCTQACCVLYGHTSVGGGRVFVYTGLLGWCVHHHGHTNVGGVECLCTQACWGDVYIIMDTQTLVVVGCLFTQACWGDVYIIMDTQTLVG